MNPDGRRIESGLLLFLFVLLLVQPAVSATLHLTQNGPRP